MTTNLTPNGKAYQVVNKTGTIIRTYSTKIQADKTVEYVYPDCVVREMYLYTVK
jgi:hypothetical protein